ncbi:hypothetical protein DL771_000543 [Monosporascus sp. 5C6A]|nr:hypothetical protein DL771_000543 [Monosporascus sp. 5C6A]
MESKDEDATQYSAVDSVQRYSVVKSTKSKKRDAIYPGSHHDAHLEPPDPDKLRSVAGGVTRRTDRVERAEPPPSSSRVRTDPKKETSRRRGQGGAGFGSDSDSDSDDGKPKRNRDDDDPKPISRRKHPESQPQDLPDLHTSKVDVEEQERLQQLRALRNVRENWAAIDERRQYFRKERRGREKRLIDVIRQMPARSPMISEAVLDYDARLRDYLDENLYGAIDKVPDGSTLTQPTDLEEIVELVEKKMVTSCSRFDAWKFSSPPIPVCERLVLVLQAIEKECWMSVLPKFFLHRNWHPQASGLCHDFMETSCPKWIDKLYQRETFIDFLLSKYQIKVMNALTDSVGHRISLYMQIQQELENKWNQRVDVPWTHDNLLWTHSYLLWSHTQTQENLKDDWLQHFRESRVDGRLTRSYMDWVIHGVDSDELARFLSEWHRVKRKEALREFLSSMAMVKIQVEQEFCPDIIQPGVVSLVLVKSNHPSTVKEVSAEDLESLGWFHETVDGQRRYWRCEPGNNDSSNYARDIFKVSMDGEVLGAYCLDGPSWAFLEYKPHEFLDAEGRRVSSWTPLQHIPRPILRPLNENEKIALDLPQSRDQSVSGELPEHARPAPAF